MADNYEKQLENTSSRQVEQARKEHKRALANLGKAKKEHDKAMRQVRLSKKLREMVNKKEIHNMNLLRKTHNKAVSAGVPHTYGLTRQQTSVGKAGLLLNAFNHMMSISKSIKSPSYAKQMSRALSKKMGLYNEKSLKQYNHDLLEAAYENCDKLGICDKGKEIFDQLVELQEFKTDSEISSAKKTEKLLKSLPPEQLIQYERADMIYRNRHQPRRIRKEVFKKRGKKFRGHSVGDMKNAKKTYKNNNTRRYRIPGKQKTLPRLMLRKKKSSKRRKSV